MMSSSPHVSLQVSSLVFMLSLSLTTLGFAQKPGGGSGGCFSICKAAPALVVGTLHTQAQAQAVAAPFELYANYPNPFNPTTTIQFALTQAGPIDVKVYNAAGQVVQTLFSGQQAAGTYQVQWDSRNAAGAVVPSGMYFVRMVMDGFAQTQKMILQK